MILSSEIPEKDQMLRHTRVSPALKGRLAQQTQRNEQERNIREKTGWLL